jgi:polyhydroxyalkanoate synthesis regulator phasin
MTTNTTATAVVMCDGAAFPSMRFPPQSSTLTSSACRLGIESLKGKLGEADEKQRKDATDHATALTGKQTQLDKANAKVATLEKQIKDGEMTPQKLDALVVERANVIAGAKKVLGDKLVIDGKTNADIRRQVVDATMKDAAKGWSDDAVTASFNTIVASVKDGGAPTPVAVAATASGRRGWRGTSFADLRQGFRFDAQPQLTDTDKAYGEMAKDISVTPGSNKAA